MTIVRTDYIVNLYPNAIADISQADPAVVTVPVIERIVSATGTVAAVAGSGPWTANITGMTTTAGLRTGDVITATDDTGSIGTGAVQITSIIGNQAIAIKAVGGTAPTAGAVTDISLPAVSTLPARLANGDAIQFTEPGNKFTFASSVKTFVAGEIITQAVSNAKGIVTNVFPNYLTYTATSGVFNTSNLVTGSFSGATTTPTAVTGMNQLLTAGENGTNTFYIDILTDNTFALYTDSGLSSSVDSSAFTAATANAGQYTTIDEVVITIPNP